MANIIWKFSDGQRSKAGAFSSSDDPNYRHLLILLKAVNANVESISSFGDTITVNIADTNSAAKTSSLESVITSYIRKDYERERLKRYSGLTNSSGQLVVAFDNPYLTTPEPLFEAPGEGGIDIYVTNLTTNGCTVNVRQSVTVNVSGTNVLGAYQAKQNVHVTLVMYNNDL